MINFQSIKKKTLELNNLIDTRDSDIIVGTETWNSSKFFPPTYEVIRKDREDRNGGVLLAIKRN